MPALFADSENAAVPAKHIAQPPQRLSGPVPDRWMTETSTPPQTELLIYKWISSLICKLKVNHDTSGTSWGAIRRRAKPGLRSQEFVKRKVMILYRPSDRNYSSPISRNSL